MIERYTLCPRRLLLTFLLFEASMELQKNKLTGEIPSVLSDLSSLRTLQLSQNLFRGTIPPALGYFPNLSTCLCRASTCFICKAHAFRLSSHSLPGTLFMYANFLHSTIPTQLGDLSTLIEIDFGSNRLTGTIPSQLGKLQVLTSLSLFDNMLTGTIPSQLANIHTLKVLYLDSNNLGPPLPTALCNRLTFDEFWADCSAIGGCDCCTKCCQQGQTCA